jgi:hypothetical protein
MVAPVLHGIEMPRWKGEANHSTEKGGQDEDDDSWVVFTKDVIADLRYELASSDQGVET